VEGFVPKQWKLLLSFVRLVRVRCLCVAKKMKDVLASLKLYKNAYTSERQNFALWGAY
jgi:hypothetical protein